MLANSQVVDHRARFVRSESASAPRTSANIGDYILAGAAVLLTVALCMAFSDPCRHWFVAPVALCGILTGADVVAWLRRRLDTFDPLAIVGLLWFHGTFVAPLLHVSLEAHSDYFDSQVYDWPKWFGCMALLTGAGLILYKLAQRRCFLRSRPARTLWALDDRRFYFALVGAIGISAIAAATILVRFRGLSPDAVMLSAQRDRMIHLSWLMMLGDPLPLLVIVALFHAMASPTRRRSAVVVGLVLTALLLAQFSLVGFRGSRTAVIYILFLGAALCHYRVRRIPLTWVLIALTALGTAGYYYAFYKRFGSAGLEAITRPEYREMLSQRAGITPVGVLLGDLSRAEIQTFLLFRLMERGYDYHLRLGRTYALAVLTIVPRAVWPAKPSELHGKVAAGTDLQYGQGTYRPGTQGSARVYGLGGEALLNFGLPGVPIAYLLYGAVLGWYRKKLLTFRRQDARYVIVPVLTLVAFTAAFGDADNTVFLALKNGLLLTAVVVFSSTRVRLQGIGAKKG